MKWKIYSGIINEPSEADYIIILDFIKECYPDLNIFDLEQCMKMIASNQLEVKKTASDESFASFSCSYIGRNLSAYKSWKKEVISNINSEISKYNLLLPAPKIQEEELLKNKKTFLLFSYNEIKQNEYNFIDYRNLVFDFLYKNKFIEVTENLKNESLLFARNKLANQKIEDKEKNKNTFNTIVDNLRVLTERMDSKSSTKSSNNIVSETTTYTQDDLLNVAASYVVVKFFLKIESIDEFLDTITIDHL